MSPALNGSSALQRFERSNVIEIHNGIMFDFYPGLPHMPSLLSMASLPVQQWSSLCPVSILSLQLYLAGWQVHVLYWPNTKHMSFLVNKSYSLFCYSVICLLVGWAWANPTLDIELWFLRWGLALFPGHTGPIQVNCHFSVSPITFQQPVYDKF